MLGSPRSWSHPVVMAPFPVHRLDHAFSLCPHTVKGARNFSTTYLKRALTPVMRAPPSWPMYLPKAPTPNTTTFGVRISTCELEEGGTRTFRLQQSIKKTNPNSLDSVCWLIDFKSYEKFVTPTQKWGAGVCRNRVKVGERDIKVVSR